MIGLHHLEQLLCLVRIALLLLVANNLRDLLLGIICYFEFLWSFEELFKFGRWRNFHLGIELVTASFVIMCIFAQSDITKIF